MWQRILLLAPAVWMGLSALADGRMWTDSTGFYTAEAEFVAMNETTVVLKKADNHLVAVPIVKLSQEDRAYLRSNETAENARRSADAMQTWTMASGLTVVGRVVDYGRTDITIQRRRGKVYVNDRLYEDLPEAYQLMLPKVVTYFEKTQIDGKKGLVAWATRQRGRARTFACNGAVLELENGDQYRIPFFFFSPDDMAILRPGWDRWLAANKERANQEQYSSLLATQAQAYRQDRMMNQTNQQIALAQLELEGAQTGLFDLWEVRMFPRPGVASPPVAVVVPGRDSRMATIEAVRRNPGFVAGAVSRVSRR